VFDVRLTHALKTVAFYQLTNPMKPRPHIVGQRLNFLVNCFA
jgi:hypothetical protein